MKGLSGGQQEVLERYYQGLPVIEARNDLRLFPEKSDWIKGEQGNPTTCGLARCSMRMFKSNAVVFFRSVAYVEVGKKWAHITTVHPRLAGNGGDLSKLRHWNLIEEKDERRADGGRAGWWRITDEGEQYLQNKLSVPKYVLIYNGRILGFDGPNVSIMDALGTKFNYQQLMAGV